MCLSRDKPAAQGIKSVDESKTVLKDMSFCGRKIQRRLGRWCRLCTFSLAVFTIYFYFTSEGTQMDNVARWDVIDTKKQVLNTKVRPFNTVSQPDRLGECPLGTFSFPEWNECRPWLNCSQISQEVRPTKRFHHGITKFVWHAHWRGHHVVFVNCSARDAVKRELCSKGLSNLERIQGMFATRLIGRCPEKPEIVTMYYKHGSLRFLDSLFRHKELSKYNNIQTRMQLVVAYAKVLRYLHNSPIGVRVMCDSPFLDKLLDQYLITDDFQLVVNDVDGLEEVTEQGGCHRKPNVSLSLQLETERQGWPRLSEPLPFQLRPVFDEKIDIWKIPWVADKIFGKVKGSDFVKSQLREIMTKCNAINPRQRPTANDVLHELLQVQKLIAKRRRVS